MFDGSIERIRCIMGHEDYTVITNYDSVVAGWPTAKMQKRKILLAFH